MIRNFEKKYSIFKCVCPGLNPLEGLSVGFGDYGLDIGLDNTLDLSFGIGKLLSINPNLLDLTFGDINLGFGIDKNLWFDMAPYSFELTTLDLSLSFDDLSLGIGLDNNLSFFKGPDISLSLSPILIDFKMPDYSLGFDTKILSFASPSLSFSTADLMFDIGDYRFGLTLINGIPSLQLSDFTMDMSLNMDLLGRFKYKEFDLSMSPDLLLDFDYDNKLSLFGSYEFMKLDYEFIDLKIGLDTIFQFNYDDWRFFMKAIPEPGLFVSYKYDYELGLTLEGLQFSQYPGSLDFLRRLRLSPDYQLTYWEKEFDDFQLTLGMPDKYEYNMGFLRGDYDMTFGKLNGKLNDYMIAGDYIAGLDISGMVDMDIAFDKPGKFGARIELPDGRWGWAALKKPSGFDIKGNFDPFNLGTPPEPEYLDDTKVNLDGPKYIGSITEDADGFAKGTVEVEWDKDKFFVQGAATGGGVACFEGAFALKLMDDDFDLKIGTPAKLLSFKPGCGDNGIEGWLHLTPSSGTIAFGSEFSWEDGFDFGVVEARAYTDYSFSASFGIAFPEIAITKATFQSSFSAGVDAKFCAPIVGCTKSITLAAVSYKGKLSGDFSSLYVRGSVSGEITVFGISSGEETLSVSVGL